MCTNFLVASVFYANYNNRRGLYFPTKELIFNFLLMTLVPPHREEICMSCHTLSHVIKQAPLCHTSSLLSLVAQQNNHVIKLCSILYELQKHMMNSKVLLIGFMSHHQCRAEDELPYRMRSNLNCCFWKGSCAVLNNNSITVIDSSIEHRADVNTMLHQNSMLMSHWHCLNLVLEDRAWLFYKSFMKQKDYGCCAYEA